MTPNLRYPAFGAAFAAGLLLSAQCLAAATSGSEDPGFSWKPRPVAPPHTATHRETTPMQPVARAHTAPPAPVAEPTASDAPPSNPAPEAEPPPPPNGGAPLSSDQLTKLYQGLSSTAREALEGMIKTKGIAGLSKMSEQDARSTFGGMPSNIRDEIQAKWDGLSDEQRTALKKLKPDDIKQMAAAQAKEIVQASVAPIMKPVETVVKTTEAVVDKTKDMLKKGREYVQKLIAHFSGAEEPRQATE